MGMSTVKQRKGGMGMSPSTSEILTSGESLAEYVPAVVKTQDVNGNEVLIRNQRQNAYEISAGTPDALIEALVDSGAPDLVYLDTFLITYRHFYTPDQVVEKLQECYQRQMEGKPLLGGIGTPSSVMNGIVSFLKKWVGAYPVDFSDTKTKKALNDFLGVIAGGEYASYGKQIQNIFAHEMAAIEIAQRQAPAEEFANMTRNPKELAVLLRDFDIFSQSSKKIAQQLTLVDFKLFRAIRSEEFALTLWGDKQKDWRTVRLRAYIDRFNRVGYWVATVVLSFQEARKRSDAVETFIKIANRCMEMQNFNTAMAIHSGLNTGPVSRLKKTFAGLSSRATAALADIENKLSYRGNYKLYRELENESKPPLLPFFGLVIKDLTFLNDGNQKTLPNGLINFEKQRMIWGIISHIRELQRHKFPFTQEDDVIVHSKTPLVASITLYSYCTNPPCLAEDQLMALSKILEPSDRDRERQKSVSGAAGRSSPGRGSPKSLSRAASRSPSCDALMDILEGNHPKGVPKLIIPAPLGAMTAEILASAPLSSSTIPSDNEGRDSAQDSGSGTNGNNSMEIQHTPSRPQTPPMMRLPSDVRGFLGGSPASPIEPHSPVLERSPKAAQRGRESLADRRMSMAGGTLRRKLSEAGLSAVLGWWKKEEAGDSSSDAG
ncbi:ras guanine nucleotide exchange factor domain-containing protein [Phlyctochytrium arcticum]|nr:ras guanine nucleotide exchange factor domain-containing protein [Phlyctochytrium arcticum]